MKYLIASLVAVALVLPTSAMANELIVGVKAGVYKPKESAFKPVPMASAQLTYEFLDLVAADFAVELEAGSSLSDGDVDTAKLGIPSGVKSKYDVQNIGLYLSARTAGPIYAIGRIGVARSEVNGSASLAGISAGVNAKDTGLSIGGGVGFSTGLRTEVELTVFDNDSEKNLYASLGFAF